MRRARKKGSPSTSPKLGKRNASKPESSLKKSSSKKNSPIKRINKSTRKKTTRSHLRVAKRRTQKTSKPRLAKRSPRLLVSRKSGIQRQKSRSGSRGVRVPSKKQASTRGVKNKIIRVLGHGQFSVDSETLRKLNAIDNSIVRRIEKENLTNEEFKRKIGQLGQIVTKKGKLLDPKVIISSDIILPGSDLTIEEASEIFHGEGLIPGLD